MGIFDEGGVEVKTGGEACVSFPKTEIAGRPVDH